MAGSLPDSGARINLLESPAMIPVALTIAGSDPSGGAGLQADLKTFHQHGVYGMSVVTLLTVQNTLGVARVEPVSRSLVSAQLDAVLADITPRAAKSGALGTAELVEWLAEVAGPFTFPLVVDPVMISKHGHPLLDASARQVMKSHLLPVTSLLTPNTHEAAVLTGRPVETLAHARDAAQALVDLGAKAVIVKGGHVQGDPIDVLYANGIFTEFAAVRIETQHTHGTGCTFSAAITANLARGLPLIEAIEAAKRWLTLALQTAPGLGHGVGPLNHFVTVR
jgi:hydroxymethylpyrimidine/phosphomethylpyrimidine kinase